MFSIMIVDDEKAIRENLAGIINFEEYGFKICGTAQNGEDALSKLDSCNPDVIFLDVCMPIMDGLAFLKETHEMNKTDFPYVVMLSGYSDFEYARSAMRYGVKAYLTKPVDEEEIGLVLVELKETLRERAKSLKKSNMQEQVNKLKGIYQSGDGNRVSFQGCQMMHCVVLKENTSEKEGWRIIREVVEERIPEGEAAFCRNQGSVLSYLLEPEILQEYQQSITLFARHLLHHIKKGGVECALLFDNILFEKSGGTFRHDYDSHLYQMLTEIFWGKDSIVQGHLPVETDFPESRLDKEEEYMGKIKKAIRSRDEVMLKAAFADIDEAVREKKLSVLFLQEINYRIYYGMMDLLAEENITNANIAPLDLRDTRCFIRYQDWKEQLWQQMFTVYACMKRKGQHGRQGIGDQALSYIRHHFREQISLQSVADAFYVSPSYLSRCLQKSLGGGNFRNYLNELRIEEAKRLLCNTDKRIYEVAEEVGFTESKYFISKFTDLTGKSPAEYRRTKG